MMAIQHLLLVNTSVSAYQLLMDAVNPHTLCVTYTWATDTVTGVQQRIRDALDGTHNTLDTIGFVFHGKGDKPFHLLQSMTAGNTRAFDISWNEHVDFMWYLRKEFLKLPSETDDTSLVPRFDFLACCMLRTAAGRAIHAKLQDLVGVPVTASVDETGNTNALNPTANWIMESHNVDARATYFDPEKILDYTFMLDKFDNLGFGTFKPPVFSFPSLQIRMVPHAWQLYPAQLRSICTHAGAVVNAFHALDTASSSSSNVLRTVDTSIRAFESAYEELTTLQTNVTTVYKAVDFIKQASRLSSGLSKIATVLHASVKTLKTSVDTTVRTLQPVHDCTTVWVERVDKAAGWLGTVSELVSFIQVLETRAASGESTALFNIVHFNDHPDCPGNAAYDAHIAVYRPVLARVDPALETFATVLRFATLVAQQTRHIDTLTGTLQLDSISKLFKDLEPPFAVLNVGLDEKLKVDLLFTKVSFSVRDVMNGISGAIADAMKILGLKKIMDLVDEKILDPLLKKIPGLDSLLIPKFPLLPSISFPLPALPLNLPVGVDMVTLHSTYQQHISKIDDFLQVVRLTDESDYLQHA